MLLYYSLPQKCGTLQQKYVPENLVHFIYVPDVPVIWYKSGTKLDPPQDGDKFTDFWIDFVQIFTKLNHIIPIMSIATFCTRNLVH